MQHLFHGVLGVAITAGAAAAAPKVHQVTASAQGLAVNAYLIEAEHGIIEIDSALTISDAKAVKAKLAELHKPLLAVIVTHGHPDHYNGIRVITDGKPVPVYATAAVAKVIRDWDAAKEQQWKPVFGAEWPAARAFPDHEVKDGARITLDGVTLIAHDLGPAESYADSYWELAGAAFIGDEVLAGSHAYTNDGHTTAWLANLDRLAAALKDAKLYPGHGPAGDAKLLAWQRAYLVAYRAAVDRLRAGKPALTAEAKQELVAAMTAAYPEATNTFMIALGADTVAAELARLPARPARR